MAMDVPEESGSRAVQTHLENARRKAPPPKLTNSAKENLDSKRALNKMSWSFS